jgi:hypothetical protein
MIFLKFILTALMERTTVVRAHAILIGSFYNCCSSPLGPILRNHPARAGGLEDW